MTKLTQDEKDYIEFFGLFDDLEQTNSYATDFLNEAKKGKHTRNFTEQEKRSVRRKSNGKIIRIKSGAAACILAISMTAGAGIKATMDKVVPYVTTYIEYKAEDNELADWFDQYDATGEGFELESNIKREISNSVFAADPMPYDYTDPSNYRVTDDGEKIGAIMDYYNGFDSFLEESTRHGYYERVYEQMQRLIAMGKNPDGLDCVYTYAELADMFEKENSKGMGVN